MALRDTKERCDERWESGRGAEASNEPARPAPRIQNLPFSCSLGTLCWSELLLTQISVGRNIKSCPFRSYPREGTLSWRIKSVISQSSIIFSALSQRNNACTRKGNFPKPIVSASRKSKLNWISAGTSCASDAPFAMSASTRTTQKFARRRSSRIMSSSDLDCLRFHVGGTIAV